MTDRLTLSNGVTLTKPHENGNGKSRFSLSRLLPAFMTPGNGKGMVHPTGAGGAFNWLFGLPPGVAATKIDYEQEVGDGLHSSVLAGPLNFLRRTFTEAPPVVERMDGETWKPDAKHKLARLLRRPNAHYSGRNLLQATIIDYVHGNAFWLKIRNALDEVIQLWWIPRTIMRPHAPLDGSAFTDYYEYRPNGRLIEVPTRDVVHFKNGLDPRDIRLGLSELGALYREIGVDDQAANWGAAILRNFGVMGVIVAPKYEKQRATPEAVKDTKEFLKSMFTGDKRGEPLVQGAPVDVHTINYNMQGLDVGPWRDVSEERVCAALGLPAAVVGFGTGLQQTKVGATMKEMRQLAWTGCIIPNQDSIAEEVDRSLLPDFEGGAEPEDVRLRFDSTQVRALWEDTNERHTRVREDFKAKIIDRATALRETRRPATDADKGVYFAGPTPSAPAIPDKPAANGDELEDAEAA